MPNFEFKPVKLVYGGDALGFDAGRTVLAPLVLPGERAEMAEVRRQRGVVHARPLRILQASPDRIEPPCPYFGRCGGCQYQHFPAVAQTTTKVEILRETLRRLGKINWDKPIPAHAGPEWNYRNQAQFKAGTTAGGQTGWGFFEAESNRLVAIDSCPILSPRLNAILAALRGPAFTSDLARIREAEILADDRDENAMLVFRGKWSKDAATALAEKCRAELPGASTVAIEGDSHLWVFGDPHLQYHVGQFTYQVSPTAFFQTSRFLIPEFVNAVVGLSPGEVFAGGPAGGVAIDLYAGVGLFALPLAQRFAKVIAVECHPRAAADLAANAAAVGGSRIRTHASTACDFLRRYAQVRPEVVVIDPPRAGVDADTLKLLVALQPQQVTYVSCGPPTLARDLGKLLRQGYRVDSIDLFDFFPQTYHIESLVRLSRTT